MDKLYDNLGTQHKKAVNKLIRTLASGKVEPERFGAVCRSISRANSKGVKKPPTAYMLFYQASFHDLRARRPGAKLGDLAKELGDQWQKLPAEQKKIFQKRAASKK
jgi:hypothetical protein